MPAAPGKPHAFKVEYMQPFVDSMKALFENHLGDRLQFGKMALNLTGKPAYDISGVITFTGLVVGRAVLSFPTSVAEIAVKRYLGMDPLPEGILPDGVGELTNIVVGRAKASLEKFELTISPPTVISGSDYTISPQRDASCISLPASSSFGMLQLEISMVDNSAIGRPLN